MNLDDKVLSFTTDETTLKKLWNEGIRTEHIIDPVGQDVLSFSFGYWQDSGLEKAPSREVLKHEFPHYELADSVEESVVWVIGAAKARYARNQAQELLERAAYELSDGDPTVTLNQVFKDSGGALTALQKRSSRINTAHDAADRRAAYLAKHDSDDIMGAPLGLTLVDEHSMGVRPGELAIVAARLKSGKSMLLINSYIAALRAGYTPILYSMELSVSDIRERVEAIYSGVSYSRLSRGRLTPEELRVWDESLDEFAAFGTGYIEKPARGERSVQHLVATAKQLQCNYIIIDQLSFIEGKHARYQSEKERFDEVIIDLKSAISSDEADMLPCFMAVQLNRDAANRNNGRGSSDNIYGSDVIAQTVDIAYGLSQTREQRQNNSIVLETLASRRTDTEAWLLEWSFNEATRINVRGTLSDMEGD